MNRRIAMALAAAVVIAVPAEGLRQIAYEDSGGILTTCWGSTTDVERGRRYSETECMARLSTDMLAAIQTVERCAPGLPWNELAAWGDAVYNLGPVIVCDLKESTAARLLKAGEREAACRQLPRWNKGKVAGVKITLPGLVKRRAREMALCMGEG